MEKAKWSSAEVVIFGVAVFCLILALVVAPVFSPGIASAQWVPLGIGAFLAFEFVDVRRRRTSA
ncbi:hypothetical protein [Arthrobacter zhaoxinii]|uniref:hypothetical protein n=1 Tax=Arthrobacter zhaoxinii TaxID=2964616 RepID=UPI002102C563|nr:hypothetical protein [Arthrobacter zhaoxinii]MCQ2001074.1 hypothetical protein [Arthrobacter zhaoxinii]